MSWSARRGGGGVPVSLPWSQPYIGPFRFVLLIALSFGACADDAAAPSSSGTRAATLTEELRIDGTDHDLVPFGNRSGGSIAVADDGTIAISQAQDHVVRFFSADGEPLEDFGGDGSGPGEFERPERIGWVGDSLWVYDPGLRRATVLTPGREFAHTVPLRQLAPVAPLEDALFRMAASFPLGLRAGGERTELVMSLLGEPPGSLGRRVFFVTATQQAEITKIDAAIPLGETSVSDGQGGSAGLPLANQTVFDAARDGSRAGFARAEMDGARGTVGVHIFGNGGDTIFSRRVPIELVPLPAAVRDSVYNRWIARLPPSLRDAVRDRADEVTHSPPLEDFIIGRDGTVWIALAKRDGKRPHIVLDPRGEPVGDLVLDGGSRIAEAERERIWVIEKDEFDVESLVRYRVQW